MQDSINRRFSLGLILTTILLANSPLSAMQESADPNDHWHQWRGPLANGVAPNADPPVEWDEATNIAWKVPTSGEGIATPVVWQNRIFLVSAVPTDRVVNDPPVADKRAMTRPPATWFQFTLECLDLETGKTIWKDVATERVPHEGRHNTSSYAAASPMTDGKRLIVSFGSAGIFCYSMEGEKQWSVDLGNMHTRRGWGEATSPVLADDLVVMNWDNEDQSFICALDAATGEIGWKVDRQEPTTWATPLVIEREGRKQVVTNGTNHIVGYDLNTGESLWTTDGTTLNAIPCPVEFDNHIICMAGYRGNRVVSIGIDGNGKTTQAWQRLKGTPYVPSPLLSDNRLYFTQSNKAILSCLDARTGELFYGPQRLEGLGNLYGSPVAAAGRVYITSREGVTLVFRDGESFEVLASNQLDDQFDASPVLVGRKLLLRGKKHLYCVEQPKN